MAVLVTLPDLGAADAEGVVAEWYRADGAAVDTGELVCRVEFSFVAFEVEAEGPGLLHHRMAAGAVQRSGAPIAQILERGEILQDDQVEDLHGPIAVDWPVTEGASEVERQESAAAPPAAFEDHLVESVVVPFPGAFAGTTWRAAAIPEEPVAFDPTLFGEAEHERTAALIEPGGSIPGLPLWEPDDLKSAPTALPVTNEAHQRFSRITDEAVAASQVLTASISVDLSEAVRMRVAFERSWRASGNAPLVEDIVFRGIALALEETQYSGCDGAMIIANRDSDVSCAVANPAALTFREAVTTRFERSGEPFESAPWLLVSLRNLGVSSATSRLEPGRVASFALAASGSDHLTTLTMTYDSAHWSEGSAGRLLARIRDILEVPYTMLT